MWCPSRASQSRPRLRRPPAPVGARPGIVLRLTLSNRVLWILALGFFVMNAVRYSFMNWGVQYMADFHGRSIKNSVLTAIMIPLAGCVGGRLGGLGFGCVLRQTPRPGLRRDAGGAGRNLLGDDARAAREAGRRRPSFWVWPDS